MHNYVDIQEEKDLVNQLRVCQAQGVTRYLVYFQKGGVQFSKEVAKVLGMQK